MNALTAVVRNYIIIFPDRSRRFITKSQSQKICQMFAQENIMVKIDDARYPINMLKHSAIMPLTEYYEQYPNEKPAVYNDIIRIFGARPIYEEGEARRGLIEGLSNYIKRKPANNQTGILFKYIQKKE